MVLPRFVARLSNARMRFGFKDVKGVTPTAVVRVSAFTCAIFVSVAVPDGGFLAEVGEEGRERRKAG